MAHEILADAGFANIDAELEQFTVNARCSPKRILAAHLPNQLADFFRHRRPPRLAATDFPGPEQTEAPAVPSNHSVRFDDNQSRPPACAWRISRIKRLSEFGTSLDSASATGTNRDQLVIPFLPQAVPAGALPAPQCARWPL